LDLFSLYIKDIKTPLLTAEQEIALGKRIQKGDKKALEQLILSNLRIPIFIAKKFKAFNQMDLIQEGNIALIEAAKKFNPELGFRFYTFAGIVIKNRLITYINEDRLMKVPYNSSTILGEVARTKELLSQELSKEPTISDIANYMGKDKSYLDDLLTAIDISSLNVLIDKSEETELLDLVPSNKYSPERDAMNKSIKQVLKKYVGMLEVKEKQVVSGRLMGLSYDDIGTRLGISKQRVLQIWEKAARKLRMHTELKEWVYE
jgi:RNA polymerase sigma factor (sigma-70 family)